MLSIASSGIVSSIPYPQTFSWPPAFRPRKQLPYSRSAGSSPKPSSVDFSSSNSISFTLTRYPPPLYS